MNKQRRVRLDEHLNDWGRMLHASENAPVVRTGDLVKHKESGETWKVLQSSDGCVSVQGSPDVIVYLEDVDVVWSASDKEHQAELDRLGLEHGKF